MSIFDKTSLQVLIQLIIQHNSTLMIKLHGIRYYLSDHPTIVNFRWSSNHSWGSTWSFVFTFIPAYIAAAVTLHLILTLFRRRRPVPLGPIPAFHSLMMALISSLIFIGMLLSAADEIRDTRWLWRRTKTTPLQWLLCFPLGTRPSGRVFFWSYAFYLSRFLHLLRTFFTILQRRRLTTFHLLNQSFLIFMSFLWLEFSQSFQVLAILSTTLLYSVIYGYRFLLGMGMRGACFPLVANCQVALLGCNLACHVGVLVIEVFKGGCNGMGAWLFNSVLNAAILLLFMRFYVETHMKTSTTSSNVEQKVENSSCYSHWGSGNLESSKNVVIQDKSR